MKKSKPLQKLWQSQPCHGQKLLPMPISMCFVQSVDPVYRAVNGSSWNFIMPILLLKAACKQFKHEDKVNCSLNMVGMVDHKDHNNQFCSLPCLNCEISRSPFDTSTGPADNWPSDDGDFIRAACFVLAYEGNLTQLSGVFIKMPPRVTFKGGNMFCWIHFFHSKTFTASIMVNGGLMSL